MKMRVQNVWFYQQAAILIILCAILPSTFCKKTRVVDTKKFQTVTSYNLKSNRRSMVSCDTFIDLPFSAEIGYNAFSDLPRQPLWSPFLQKVIYTDLLKRNSKWTMNMLGIEFGWTAICIKDRRRKLMKWKSTSGTWNKGIVRFITLEDGDKVLSRMFVKIEAEAPKAIASLFARSSAVQSFFENMVIKRALKRFKKEAYKNDFLNKQKINKNK